MIRVLGSVQRSFIFPGKLNAAFDYYADMDRTLLFLSHISTVERYSSEKFRMLFSTTELGIYKVRIFCDIQVHLNRQENILRILPFKDFEPVHKNAGVNSLTSQGYFSSESRFKDTGGQQTEIEYQLNLRAELPVPYGLRIMPRSIINTIARNITHWRIHETAGDFIERSVQAFSQST